MYIGTDFDPFVSDDFAYIEIEKKSKTHMQKVFFFGWAEQIADARELIYLDGFSFYTHFGLRLNKLSLWHGKTWICPFIVWIGIWQSNVRQTC